MQVDGDFYALGLANYSPLSSRREIKQFSAGFPVSLLSVLKILSSVGYAACAVYIKTIIINHIVGASGGYLLRLVKKKYFLLIF